MAVVTRRIYWLLGIAALVAAGGVFYWRSTTAQPVETVRVQPREVVEIYVATGRIEARRTSEVGVEIGGLVERVAAQEGDEVERGDLLVEIRPRDAELVVERAEATVETLANELAEIRRGPTDAELRGARAEVARVESSLAQAERDLDRARKLYERGAATEQELERAQTALQERRAELENARAGLERLRERPLPEEVKAARARLAEAKVDLEQAREDVAKTSIRAPFSGLVLAVSADEGERLETNQTVARLADMSTAEIYAEVDEDYFGRIEPGQRATLIFPSMPGESFDAEVRQVGPEISTDRGVVGVHLDPKSLPDDAFPGLTVDVNIEVARLADALALPAESVLADAAGSYVVAVVDGRAVRREVDVRARGEEWVALAGLEAGDEVVRRAAKVELGDALRPVAGDEA